MSISSWMYLTSIVPFQYQWCKATGAQRLSWEQAASHFSIPDIKLICAPALLEEARDKINKPETWRHQSPLLLRPEKQWPMEHTTYHAYMTRGKIHMHTFQVLSSQAVQMLLHSCMLVMFCGQHATDPTSLSCCAEHLQENEKHNHNSQKLKLTSLLHAL